MHLARIGLVRAEFGEACLSHTANQTLHHVRSYEALPQTGSMPFVGSRARWLSMGPLRRDLGCARGSRAAEVRSSACFGLVNAVISWTEGHSARLCPPWVRSVALIGRPARGRPGVFSQRIT
jgi:hypothetical protein